MHYITFILLRKIIYFNFTFYCYCEIKIKIFHMGKFSSCTNSKFNNIKNLNISHEFL